MNILIILTLLFNLSTALAVSPDDNKADCEAFSGKWKRYCLKKNSRRRCIEYSHFLCENREEYQQRAIKTGFFKSNKSQWCYARGGEWKKSGRSGFKCLGANKVGSKRFPLDAFVRADTRNDLASFNSVLLSCQNSGNCLSVLNEHTKILSTQTLNIVKALNDSFKHHLNMTNRRYAQELVRIDENLQFTI